jgi:hypothetical protein
MYHIVTSIWKTNETISSHEKREETNRPDGISLSTHREIGCVSSI